MEIVFGFHINQICDECIAFSGNINRAKYIHYSAEIGTVAAKVIHPNASTDNNQRHIYPCDESSS
jgi:hypothetical protein